MVFKRAFLFLILFLSLYSSFAQEPRLVLPIGHSLQVNSIKFSKDGKKIISASDDFRSKIWDVNTGLLLIDLEGHSEPVMYAAFSPDGNLATTASTDSSAKIWDVKSGKMLFNLRGHSDMVFFSEFSPNGKMVITASYDTTFRIWDVQTGKLLHVINSFTYPDSYGEQTNPVISSDGRKLISNSNDSTLKVWDIETGAQIKSIDYKKFGVKFLKVSPEGDAVVFISQRNTLKVINIESGKEPYEIAGENGLINDVYFSKDGKRIIASSQNKNLVLFDTNSGAELSSLKVSDGSYYLSLSPDGKKIFIRTDSAAEVWDFVSGTKLFSINRHSYFGVFSSDSKKLITNEYHGYVEVWDIESGKLLYGFNGRSSEVFSASFNSDGKKILTASSNNNATIWDINAGKIEKIFKHDIWVLHAEFTYNDKYIVTITNGGDKIWDVETGSIKEIFLEADKISRAKLWGILEGRILDSLNGDYYNYPKSESDTIINRKDKFITFNKRGLIEIGDYRTKKIIKSIKIEIQKNIKDFEFESGKLIHLDNSQLKVYNFNTGKLLCSFINIDSSDYISVLPNGYYLTTPSSTKLLHYVTKDLKVISFEQLDVKYNRPDKVLEAIGNPDTALIKSYRKAWEKRIKKLGIDTTQFRDGYSVPEADFVNRDSIEFEQKAGTLRLHIRGIDSTYKLDRFNVWVNESPLFGQRGISIKKKNSNSIDTTITIKLSQGENRIETSITNVNGTESYRMPLYVNYTPAVKEKEMIRFIGIGIDQFKESQYNLGYSSKDIRDLAIKLKERYKDSIIIDTLFNQDVTAEKVKALKQKLQQTTVNDKVIVSYSGHGLLSKDYDYYLSTYAVNFNKPEENGLPYDELENLLDSIPARKKLMFIDACHSGEVDKEEGIAMQKMADSLGLAAKGLIIDQLQQQQVGLKNSFELMQSLFVNVGKSTGATIISAAAGNQFALERGDLKNGVFTYSLLEAMNKYPTIKISELKKIVGERVEQLTNGLQKPTSRNEAIAVDWSLW